ncbi:hypothetical protein [Bifidobacterium asteroides]|uniref:hypothetical protein n=1 Tax=Bifidobacterium asteroides TaxID=1684 RepID=UPI003A81336E
MTSSIIRRSWVIEDSGANPTTKVRIRKTRAAEKRTHPIRLVLSLVSVMSWSTDALPTLLIAIHTPSRQATIIMMKVTTAMEGRIRGVKTMPLSPNSAERA